MEPPRFLVTAGGTRESIDRVREWGNVFTGRTGYGIARALTSLGQVTLLTSNGEHVAAANAASSGHPIDARPFRSYDDLKTLLEAEMASSRFNGVFMTAAMSDYSPNGAYQVVNREIVSGSGEEIWRVRPAQAPKVKSTFDELAVLGRRTDKLVDLFRTRWRHDGLLVKFKLEVGISTDELLRIGKASRLASGADYLVANTLDMVEGETAGAYLISESNTDWIPRADLPERLRVIAEQWLAGTR